MTETTAGPSSLHIQNLFPTAELEQAIADGYVRVQHHPDLPYRILNYAEKTVFEKAWTPVTLACRGLIIDDQDHVVARPFRKFFNYSEHPEGSLDLGARVVVTDKMDGSLGILYPTPDGHAIATRGSFTSVQALHATKLWNERYVDYRPSPDLTLLFEILYPANRIVCDYGGLDDLVLLGAVETETGVVIDARWIPWPGPKTDQFLFSTFADALAAPPRPGAEGLVVRFRDHNDLMIKLKQADYVELHRIVTGLNARIVWEHIGKGGTIAELCEPLPDEFHTWVEDIAFGLQLQAEEILKATIAEDIRIRSQLAPGWTRKDFALLAKDATHAALLFLLLDNRDPWPKIWAKLQPSGADRPFNAGEDAS